MELKRIYADTQTISINSFKGLNRRKITGLGEFSDMENLGHKEYPCICSEKTHRQLDFALPDGVKAVRLMFPKHKNQEPTGFSGVAYNLNTNFYELYVDGNVVSSNITSFKDIIDYNGTFIVFPQMVGKNTISNEDVRPPHIGGSLHEITFASKPRGNLVSDGYECFIHIQGITYRQYLKIQEDFPAGTQIMLTGFEGYYEGNNTYFPTSSGDHSRPNSISTMVVSSINCNAVDPYLGQLSIGLSCKNSKGEEIQWPVLTDSNSPKYAGGNILKYVPPMECGCVAHNRVWGCGETGEYIYCSALGEPLEFMEIMNLSSDSWHAQVGTPGKFTGISPWQNRVVVFKSHSIHIVYGDLPTNFSIERSYGVGCVDRSSIMQVNNMLIWMYDDGFYTYSGGKPVRISDKLNTPYKSCTAFTDGRRYFGICTKENGTKELISYDTELGLWDKISNPDLLSGDYYKGVLYGCSQDNVFVLGDGEYGDFYGETGDMMLDSFRDKAFLYLNVRCIIDKGFLNIYTRVNNGQWIPHKGISTSGKYRIPIRYKSGDILKLRMEGHGEICIFPMDIEANIK